MVTIDVGPERDLPMAREHEHGSLEPELVELRKHQTQLFISLKLLVDLLEEYAPSWYTEEHHTQALAALRCGREQDPSYVESNRI